MENTTTTTIGKVGRPSVITAEIIDKLETAFRMGVTDVVALSFAKLSPRTYYDRLSQDAEFKAKIEAAKHYSRLLAGSVVMKALHANDVKTARWWLQKKHPDEFDTRKAAVEVNTNILNYVPGQLTDEQLEQRRRELEERIAASQAGAGHQESSERSDVLPGDDGTNPG